MLNLDDSQLMSTMKFLNNNCNNMSPISKERGAVRNKNKKKLGLIHMKKHGQPYKRGS